MNEINRRDDDLETYKVIKEIRLIFRNIKIGNELIRKENGLFDKKNKWICEVGSAYQLECTELIKKE